MHNSPNTEYFRATQQLIIDKVVKNKEEAADKLGVSSQYYGAVCNGKEKPSALFKKKFETTFKVRLRDFKEEIEIKFQPPKYATYEEFIADRIQYLELMTDELLAMQSQILSELFKMSQPKNPVVDPKKIAARAKDRVRAKAEAIQAAQGGKQVS